VSLKTQQVAAAVSLFFSIDHCFYDEILKKRNPICLISFLISTISLRVIKPILLTVVFTVSLIFLDNSSFVSSAHFTALSTSFLPSAISVLLLSTNCYAASLTFPLPL
jgi:hypothetical protein